MNKNQSAKNMGIVKKPNSTNNKKKKLSKKIQLQIAGVRVLKMAAFCLAVVSWYATGQGLISFVFGDTSMGLGDGFLGKNTQAFMISFGIQGSLLSLSMYMPQYWKEAKKKKGDRGKSKGRMLMAIYYAVCLVASFTFSFISFSESVYEKTQYINSDITLRQQFQTTLSETERYILDSQEQLLMEIRNVANNIADTSKKEENLNEINAYYNNNSGVFYECNESDLNSSVQKLENGVLKEKLDMHPHLKNGALVVRETMDMIENVNLKMEVYKTRIEKAITEEEVTNIIDDMENWCQSDLKLAKVKTPDPEGDKVQNVYYSAIYNSEVTKIIARIEEMKIQMEKLKTAININSTPQTIMDATLGDTSNTMDTLNETLNDIIRNASINESNEISNEDMYIIQTLKNMVERYIELDKYLGTQTDKLPEQKTIYALKNAYVNSPISVPGQILNADKVVDENMDSEMDSTDRTEESTTVSKQEVKITNDEFVSEEEVKIWRNEWSQRLKYLEEIIRGLPYVSITDDSQVVAIVETVEATTVTETVEATTMTETVEATTTTETVDATTVTDTMAVTTAESIENESIEDESWITKFANKLLDLFTKEEKLSFGERMQEEANALIKSSRKHLSDINPIEKYFTIMIKGPYRGMAVFSFIAAIFIDVISLFAGIAVSNINEKIKEERQKGKNENQANSAN